MGRGIITPFPEFGFDAGVMLKNDDERAEAPIVASDVQKAAQYYRCVFGAEFDGDQRLSIGAAVFRLRAGGPRGAAEAQIETVDADVTIARGVAKGGDIVEPVGDCARGGRVGVLRDPFGMLWRVRSDRRRGGPTG